MIYYVYVILDPRKPGNYEYDGLIFEYEPFYVGRGKGDRIKTTLGKGNNFKMNKIKKIISINEQPIVRKIFDNLTFDYSNTMEIEVISKIGRYELGGPLLNFTSGGEGQKEVIVSVETRKKQSNAKIGVEPWNKGVSCDKKTRDKISATLSGENNFNYGKTFSKEHRQKLSASNKEPQCLSVLQYDLDDNLINEYKSILEASLQTNVNKSSIGRCCKGDGKTAGGFKWSYTDEAINKRKKKKATKTKLKEDIYKLLNDNKTNAEISKILDCPIGIVIYHNNIKNNK